MFGSEILDVAIGLLFTYLVLSLIASAAREGIESYLKTRAAHLDMGIRQLLADLDAKGLARDLYAHPLIGGLFRGDYHPDRLRTRRDGTRGLMRRGSREALPSYVPSANFALALLDLVVRGPVQSSELEGATSPVLAVDTVRASLTRLNNPQVQRALLTALDTANGSLARAQASIEAWFNSGMDRVSGWYKRFSQQILFALGLFIAIAMNANTLEIASYLYEDQAARSIVVAHAQATARDSTILAVRSGDRRAYVDSLRADLETLSLPLGWEKGIRARGGSPPETGFARYWFWILHPLLGWLATAFAISLGAPFWFDLLNKFMVVRSTVKPHEKSPEEGSEDRRPRPPAPPPSLGAKEGKP